MLKLARKKYCKPKRGTPSTRLMLRWSAIPERHSSIFNPCRHLFDSGRPEIQQAVQRCEAAIVAADRKAALSEVETLWSSGKLSKARQTHKKVVERLGADSASDELLARIN